MVTITTYPSVLGAHPPSTTHPPSFFPNNQKQWSFFFYIQGLWYGVGRVGFFNKPLELLPVVELHCLRGPVDADLKKMMQKMSNEADLKFRTKKVCRLTRDLNTSSRCVVLCCVVLCCVVCLFVCLFVFLFVCLFVCLFLFNGSMPTGWHFDK